MLYHPKTRLWDWILKQLVSLFVYHTPLVENTALILFLHPF